MSRLGIIAGSGTAPHRLIESCRARGRDFFVFCLQGHAEPDLAQDAPHLWLALGAAAVLRDAIKSENIAEIVMIGAVRRPSLWELKPDFLALKMIGRIGLNSLGDDGLLRAIGSAMEQECGVRIIAAHDILGGVLMRQGALGKGEPDDQARQDIARGIAVARALGAVDVGQSVIVQQGIVLGVEAAEGTDALIARCAALHRGGDGGVLVKCAKPQQDDRFDLPTIGVDTVENAVKYGLCGIALEADRGLVIDLDTVRKLADDKGIFIVGVETG